MACLVSIDKDKHVNFVWVKLQDRFLFQSFYIASSNLTSCHRCLTKTYG